MPHVHANALIPLARILLVEDSHLAQMAIQRLFETLHCHVTTASTGEEALTLFKIQSYDLVFMDIELPDCNGYELSMAMRHWGKIHDRWVPIIALSIKIDREAKQQCFISGMQAVVIKPLKKPAAREVLSEFLNDQSVH